MDIGEYIKHEQAGNLTLSLEDEKPTLIVRQLETLNLEELEKTLAIKEKHVAALKELIAGVKVLME